MAGLSTNTFATVLRSNPHVNVNADTSPQVSRVVEFKELPQTFNGRKQWGDLLSPILDQRNCGACYAFAPIACLADRYALMTRGQVVPVFNPLEASMCLIEDASADEFQRILTSRADLEAEELRRSPCSGNTIYNIGRLLFRSGGVENSCIPFEMLSKYMVRTGELPLCVGVEGRHQAMCCTRLNPAQGAAAPFTTCYRDGPRTAQRQWPARLFYVLTGKDLEWQIQRDLYRWGPLTLVFLVLNDFKDFNGHGVYVPRADAQPVLDQIGHAVRVVGWGEEAGIPFWECANSWGRDWGDHGYFKIVRGDPRLQMEVNNMALWPEVGWDPPSHEQKASQVNIEDARERAFNDVSPITFYPARSAELIKQGHVYGELTPVFNRHGIGQRSDFIAAEVGGNPDRFATIDAPSTSEGKSPIGNGAIALLTLLGSLVVGIILAIILYVLQRTP